jgi:hypothetical protein
MMADDSDYTHEEKIRTLAYELWQKDGSPDDRADEYWEAARAQVESEGGAGSEQEGSAPIAAGSFDEDADTPDTGLKR